MNNNEKCTILPSKLTLQFNVLPDNEEIDLITELELSVNVRDINGTLLTDLNYSDSIINIEDPTEGLNVSFTLYQLQCITEQAEKLVTDTIKNCTD